MRIRGIKDSNGSSNIEILNPLIHAAKWMRGKKGLLLGAEWCVLASMLHVLGWQVTTYCHPVKDQPRQESSMVANWEWKF